MSGIPTESKIGCERSQRDFDYTENLNLDYENQIQELHRRLQIAKEERKKSQSEAKILEQRVTLLLNQEKIALRKYESTKNKLDDICNKRKFIADNHSNFKMHRENINKNTQIIKEKIQQRRESLKSATNISNKSRRANFQTS